MAVLLLSPLVSPQMQMVLVVVHCLLPVLVLPRVGLSIFTRALRLKVMLVMSHSLVPTCCCRQVHHLRGLVVR
jgi:hypothetical protein